jgi:hypothetical protein
LKRFASRGIVLLASLLATPTTIPDHRIPRSRYLGDPRLARLQKFFQQRGCPAADLAEEFLLASDHHNLDWRLLPSISFVESSGGKHYINNNIMGWGSSRSEFTSVRSGIQLVASRLAKSKYYKNKTLSSILRTYNPKQEYAPTVLQVMRTLGPD